MVYSYGPPVAYLEGRFWHFHRGPWYRWYRLFWKPFPLLYLFPLHPLISTWNSNKQWAWAWYHWYQTSPPMTRRGPIPGPRRPLALFLNRHGGESHPRRVVAQQRHLGTPVGPPGQNCAHSS